MNAESLDSLNFVLNYTYFGLTLALEILVLVLVRLRLDPSMMIISAVYLLSFFFKLPFI